MSIHRISDVQKGDDETYRQKNYKKKRSGGASPESAESLGTEDIYDIRSASALLNKYSAEFSMELFGDINTELNRVVTGLQVSGLKLSDVVKNYPSDAVIKLSRHLGD